MDVEVTGYFKFVKDMDDVDVKLRGGHHRGNGEADSAQCYIFRVNPEKFGKEFSHSGGKGYSWHDLKEQSKFDLDFKSLEGKWIGLKAVTWNEGEDKVHCECYLDLDGVDASGDFHADKQNWKEWYNIIDTDGKYGDDNKDHQTSKAWTKLQKGTIQFRVDAKEGNMNMEYYSDDSTDHKATFKLLSAREIEVPH